MKIQLDQYEITEAIRDYVSGKYGIMREQLMFDGYTEEMDDDFESYTSGCTLYLRESKLPDPSIDTVDALRYHHSFFKNETKGNDNDKNPRL